MAFDRRKLASITDGLVECGLGIECGDPDAELELSKFIDGANPELLWRLGRKLLSNDDRRLRRVGIRLLRELPESEYSVSTLLKKRWESDNDPEIQLDYLEAFGFISSNSVIDKVLSFGANSDARVRDAVATALGNQTGNKLDDASKAGLIELAVDPDFEVQFSAIFEIGTWWSFTHDPVLRIAMENFIANSNDARALDYCRSVLLEG